MRSAPSLPWAWQRNSVARLHPYSSVRMRWGGGSFGQRGSTAAAVAEPLVRLENMSAANGTPWSTAAMEKGTNPAENAALGTDAQAHSHPLECDCTIFPISYNRFEVFWFGVFCSQYSPNLRQYFVGIDTFVMTSKVKVFTAHPPARPWKNTTLPQLDAATRRFARKYRLDIEMSAHCTAHIIIHSRQTIRRLCDFSYLADCDA